MEFGDVRTAITMGVREYIRTPVLLGLLLVLPAYLIGLFGYAGPDTPVPVQIPSAGQTTVPLANVITVLGVVLVTAIVGGLVGLFVVQSATDADNRLIIAGVDPASLLIARGALVLIAAVGAVGVSLGVTLVTFDPAHLGGLAVAGLLTALIYGMLGIIVGSQVDLLAGVWILLFAPLLDVVLFQNPLATETKAVATLLPAHATMRLATDAGFGTGIDWTPVAGAVGYLAVTTIVATLLYYRRS